MHALIADDDPGTCLTISAAVERLGHRCTVTEDGEGGSNRIEVHRAAGAPSADGIRLLVADDDPMIRLTLAALIEREADFVLVGSAEDAEQAIEMAARRGPDVVLLEFNMPGGGGVRAAMQIRDAIPNVKLVAVSADDSAAAQYEMSRAGAVGYVVKGSPDEEIVRVIRSSVRW